ncbi:hypothetical protein Golomagni_06925, partial [Golovinomyces magnicellulatus]
HITQDLIPAFNGQNSSSRYLAFITGGVLPIAEWADNVVSRYDQNVQVDLPTQTIATAVEDAALEMLVRVLGFQDQWKGRTFTTGATASNILGLACGREMILQKRLPHDKSVGDLGLLAACMAAGVKEIQILTSAAHSSLSKAASVVGLGRASVKQLPRSQDQPWRLDIDAVEQALKTEGVATIIAISAGDVNAGGFAVDGLQEWKRLRQLADQHGAWIHVDGAFGIFARTLPKTDEYIELHRQLDGVELADSITIDGHKVLNVPYDCGMLLTRSPSTLQAVCTNPNAAYLSSSATGIPSPLNIGLENSRRFRALPVYAVLMQKGRAGIAEMVGNMVQLCRRIVSFVRESPHYEWWPDANASLDTVFMTIMFRATDKAANDTIVDRINATRQLAVSNTVWRGEKGLRLAASNWKVDADRDGRIIADLLTCVAEGRDFDISKYEGDGQ